MNKKILILPLLLLNISTAKAEDINELNNTFINSNINEIQFNQDKKSQKRNTSIYMAGGASYELNLHKVLNENYKFEKFMDEHSVSLALELGLEHISNFGLISGVGIEGSYGKGAVFFHDHKGHGYKRDSLLTSKISGQIFNIFGIKLSDSWNFKSKLGVKFYQNTIKDLDKVMKRFDAMINEKEAEKVTVQKAKEEAEKVTLEPKKNILKADDTKSWLPTEETNLKKVEETQKVEVQEGKEQSNLNDELAVNKKEEPQKLEELQKAEGQKNVNNNLTVEMLKYKKFMMQSIEDLKVGPTASMTFEYMPMDSFGFTLEVGSSALFGGYAPTNPELQFNLSLKSIIKI